MDVARDPPASGSFVSCTVTDVATSEPNQLLAIDEQCLRSYCELQPGNVDSSSFRKCSSSNTNQPRRISIGVTAIWYRITPRRPMRRQRVRRGILRSMTSTEQICHWSQLDAIDPACRNLSGTGSLISNDKSSLCRYRALRVLRILAKNT